MPKVSIVIPVYNAEAHLPRLMESLLAQDEPDFEVIAVDDGSRDGSLAVLRDYAARDARIRPVHQENGGVSAARNHGLSLASGTYVQFADADDWLPMDSVKILSRELENTGADLAVADFYRVMEGNVSRKGSIREGGVLTVRQYADEMLKTPADFYYGVLWNKLYRRDILEAHAVRMDEAVHFSEDMIFNLQYLVHTETVAVCKAPVYYYIHTKGSLVDQSTNLPDTVKMKRTVIRWYDAFFRQIFDEENYEERRMAIYGFLLAVGRDGFSLPFAPGTKKLGRETGALADASALPDGSPAAAVYVRMRYLVRLLDTLAKRYRREGIDLQVLYFLKQRQAPCTAEEAAAFTGHGRTAVLAALMRLAADRLAVRVKPEKDGQAEGYLFAAPQMARDLDQVDADYEAACTEDMTEEEKERYLALNARVTRKLLSRLQPGEG